MDSLDLMIPFLEVRNIGPMLNETYNQRKNPKLTSVYVAHKPHEQQ